MHIVGIQGAIGQVEQGYNPFLSVNRRYDSLNTTHTHYNPHTYIHTQLGYRVELGRSNRDMTHSYV